MGQSTDVLSRSSCPDQGWFSEVAELKTIWWLEIHGKIRTQTLSPNTTYGAYLIMKISHRAYGLDSMPSEVSISVGDRVYTNTPYLSCRDSMKQQMKGEVRVPCERKDGWMEIELGEFFSGEKDEEVKMSLMEVKGYQLKAGLIIEGIEVKPK
ncbi:F-box protein PP2-B13 [Camellia lanceoleosa]|uniref:F-box protein PP2-B13 n=1 Tax=Camellia lanceoleosa TaxID=1840588 RepID=A0ACC0IRR6_9ERIC|nr:F-box protein PP2-B13 [Camellia lanceoleosa]